MLFMVIENFKQGQSLAIARRFKQQGRMLANDVNYLQSWIDPAGERCFQVMEAPTKESLQPRVERWSDLIDFKIVSILTSQEFWSRFEA